MATTSSTLVAIRRLEGKVALITGGASGIGRSTAKFFASHGAKVVIADIQDDLGHSLCDSLGETNSQYVHCNVADELHVKRAVDKADESYGKLDIMFNNAGVSSKAGMQIVQAEKADFDRVLALNITGVFLGTKHAARVMIPRGSGSIISTASVASCIAVGVSHAYLASKHAVLGLTKNAAFELWRFGIRVNCVSPSGVATPLVTKAFKLSEEMIENIFDSVSNLKSVTLKDEDVANAALCLAGDEARCVSGHNLLVDGGFSTVNPSLSMFLSKFDR